MKRTSYYLAFIVIAGGILVSFWAYQKYFKEEEPNYLFFEVEKGNLQEIVKVRGVVVAEKEFDLEFPFSGTVEEIYVQEGQSIAKGEPMMKLETIDFELELAGLQAQSAQASATIQTAQAQLSQAQAMVEVAEKDVQQFQSAVEVEREKLVELNRGTREEEIRITETAVENAQKSLEDAELELKNTNEKAERDLETLVQKSIDLLQLTSVTSQKVLSQNLQEIIYPIRYPTNKTCDPQFSSFSPGDIRSDCYTALQASEALEEVVSNLDSETLDVQSALENLRLAKDELEKVRTLLRSSLELTSGVIGLEDESGAMMSATDEQKIELKNSVTSAQTELESIMSQVTNQIESIQNQLTSNKTLIDDAQKKVNQALNTLRSSEDELALKQAGTLPERISAQEAQIQQAEAQLGAQYSLIEKEKYSVGAQEAQLRHAKASVGIIRAQMDQIREKIKKSTLHAPAEAKVVKIWLEEGEAFGSALTGKTAISLSSPGHKIQADVSELDIGKIREVNGNDISIELDAFPDQEFTGNVLSIEPKEITKEGDRYYRVNASIGEHSDSVRAGMSADLFITISSKEDVLKIPEFAVTEKEGKQFTTVLEGEEMNEVEIETGIYDGELVEVTKGLREGQTLAISAE